MTEQIKGLVDRHLQTVRDLTDEHLTMIEHIAGVIVESIRAGGKVLVAGNGGSAADAQHIAGEFVGRLLYDRRALPAIALSTDSSVLTCVGNDYGFDDIFLRQVQALISEKDVFWGLSTSGGSTNIVAAAEAAKQRGATVVAFTGSSGGLLAKLANRCLTAPADRTDRIQEIHMLAYHIVCQRVEETLCPR